jgi:S-DNA-T family DNA segregation ATPase FtsK/SpoIIIE
VAPDVLPPAPEPTLSTVDSNDGQPSPASADVSAVSSAAGVSAVSSAADSSGVPSAVADFIDLLGLPRPGEAYRLVLGTVKAPGSSKPASFAFNPTRDNSLGITGPSGSGKSACLRSVAASVMRLAWPVASLPLIYQLGPDAELAPIAMLPTARGATGDAGRIAEVLAELDGLLDERLSLPVPPSGEALDHRPVLVLVDDVVDFARRMEPMAPGALRFTLGRVLSQGGPVGMHVVLTADAAAELDPWISSNVGRWIPLQRPGSGIGPGVAKIGSTPIRFAALDGELPGRSVEDSFRQLATQAARQLR